MEIQILKHERGLRHVLLVPGGRAVAAGQGWVVEEVRRAFALSWERLDPETPIDALAIDLLARAACLAAGDPAPTVTYQEPDLAHLGATALAMELLRSQRR